MPELQNLYQPKFFFFFAEVFTLPHIFRTSLQTITESKQKSISLDFAQTRAETGPVRNHYLLEGC